MQNSSIVILSGGNVIYGDSSKDEVVIGTPKTLTLNGGGSYLKLSESGIEHGTNGDFVTKASNYLVPGSGNTLPADTPDFKKTDISVTGKNSAKWASE